MPSPPSDSASPCSVWQVWDRRLFLLMGAGPTQRTPTLCCATSMARWSWLPMTAVLLGQVGLEPDLGGWVITALLLAGVLQWVTKRLTRRWPVARPFALGLCPNHLQHGPRGGFPSAHAIVMGFVVGMLACLPVSPVVWWSLWVLSIGTAWARVHAGAHFVSDMVAGLCVGGLLGWVVGMCSSA